MCNTFTRQAARLDWQLGSHNAYGYKQNSRKLLRAKPPITRHTLQQGYTEGTEIRLQVAAVCFESAMAQVESGVVLVL